MLEEEREVVVSSVKRKRSKPKRQKENVTRKCHQCKAKAMDAVKCAYFLPTGHMCKKSFCFDCLLTDYDLPEEEYRHDWQYVHTLKIIYLFVRICPMISLFSIYNTLSLSLFSPTLAQLSRMPRNLQMPCLYKGKGTRATNSRESCKT